MMIKHGLWIACAASLAAAACKKDQDTKAEPASAASVRETPVGKEVTPSGALSAAIDAVNACKPDEDCPAVDQLEDAARDLAPDQYRGARKRATSREARRVLAGAVAAHLDEPLLRELMTASEACPSDGSECPADDDFSLATSELTPELFRAGMKAAKTPSSKRSLIGGVMPKMNAALIADIAPLIGDEELGSVAQNAVARVEDTGALAQLAALLDRHDRSDAIHSNVPELLQKYPNNPSVKAALPKLREMAKHDAQGWGKARAATAVAKIEGAGSVPFLVDYLNGESWAPARAWLVPELAAFKANPAAAAELKKLAKDPDAEVRAAVTKALK